MFKLPDIFRPYAGKVIAAIVVSGGAALASKIPGIDKIITPEFASGVAGIITVWMFGSAINTGVNAKINPTNAATPELAKSVPANIVPKSEGTQAGTI